MRFDRKAWSALRADTAMTLSEADVEALRGISTALSIEEVEEVYLPLSRLVNLHVEAAQSLHAATATFLGHRVARVPFLIGMAGSVAAGKSTAARVLRTLLARWPASPRVDLVTTDGFLLPNAKLEARGILDRKGFPESYDRGGLLNFVSQLKSGAPRATCPVYSHLTYDIVPDAEVVVERPDIVIIEGLNVLQYGQESGRVFVSDYFDMSVYIDADLRHLRRWYEERFRALRDSAFQDPESYFHRYASLSDADTKARADQIWRTINEVNLRENILPTRERASLILRKGSDHRVCEVRLRKL